MVFHVHSQAPTSCTWPFLRLGRLAWSGADVVSSDVFAHRPPSSSGRHSATACKHAGMQTVKACAAANTPHSTTLHLLGKRTAPPYTSGTSMSHLLRTTRSVHVVHGRSGEDHVFWVHIGCCHLQHSAVWLRHRYQRARYAIRVRCVCARTVGDTASQSGGVSYGCTRHGMQVHGVCSSQLYLASCTNSPLMSPLMIPCTALLFFTRLISRLNVRSLTSSRR